MNEVSKTKSFLIALIIIIGLVFLNLPSLSNPIKDFFYSISNPLQEKFDYLLRQIKSSWEFLKDLKEISQKNTKLEKKIEELMAENSQLKEVEKENQFLRSGLDLSSRREYQLELANIIGRDFQGLENYILIDKGKRAGIKENMPVIIFKNILVGKVIKVLDNSSKVILITSPNSKIPTLIQESRVEGLVKGTGDNLLFLDLIPKNIEVEENQTVITSGMGRVFPKGLLIGKISSVESRDDELFQKIRVVPAAKVENLEQVFLIKNQNSLKNR